MVLNLWASPQNCFQLFEILSKNKEDIVFNFDDLIWGLFLILFDDLKGGMMDQSRKKTICSVCDEGVDSDFKFNITSNLYLDRSVTDH